MAKIDIINYPIKKLEGIRDFLLLKRIEHNLKINAKARDEKEQHLDIYWDQACADELFTWGHPHVWKEILLLLNNKQGKVLDIACGNGPVMLLLQDSTDLDVYGVDISDLLIDMAKEAGIDPSKLLVGDATKLTYAENEFDYSYSIGSLEHFTEEGIDQFVSECHRVTAKTSYHQIPTAKGDGYQGWLNLNQSFFNMPIDWWLEKFHKSYSTVQVLPSTWGDLISNGTWFACTK